MLLRRGIALASMAAAAKTVRLPRACGFFSKAGTPVLRKESGVAPRCHNVTKPELVGYGIEVVDNESWRISSGLAQAWREERSLDSKGGVDELIDGSSQSGERDPDFDDVDNMRIRGNLFYKIDRDSKEFEEYSFDFHGRKKNPKNLLTGVKGRTRKPEDRKDERRDRSPSPRKENPKGIKPKQNKGLPNSAIAKLDSVYDDRVGKKTRTPTFNQLTGPFHEPFCLDIFISKASVRACIVHRVTSKVVAVAHSISKDMKFDLTSTKNATACSAVGLVLAQRALADDIHDAIYTPRKGERIEGKLELVLQSVIDNGINVKVKLKQRHFKNKPPTKTAFEKRIGS